MSDEGDPRPYLDAIDEAVALLAAATFTPRYLLEYPDERDPHLDALFGFDPDPLPLPLPL